MNTRQVAVIARRTERERVERRLARISMGRCPDCGERPYRVGPYLICRNLRCERLVAK